MCNVLYNNTPICDLRWLRCEPSLGGSILLFIGHSTSSTSGNRLKWSCHFHAINA